MSKENHTTKEGKLIIVTAPSGAGKTTIVRRVIDEIDNLAFSVSACTRKKRENEVYGEDYYFLSLDEFRRKITEDAFVEWEEVYKDQFYGTLKSEISSLWEKGKHVIFDVDVKGARSLKRVYGESAMAIFILPPSIEELIRRLTKRGTEDAASLKKRTAKAEYELSFKKYFDETVVNDDLEVAIAEVKDLIDSFVN